MDGLENDGGGTQRQAGAAIFLRYQRSQIAVAGQRRDERFRIGLRVVEFAPVAAGEIGTYACHGIADFGEIAPEIHDEGRFGHGPGPPIVREILDGVFR